MKENERKVFMQILMRIKVLWETNGSYFSLFTTSHVTRSRRIRIISSFSLIVILSLGEVCFCRADQVQWTLTGRANDK